MTTISTLPVESTTVMPMFIVNPRAIATVAGKRPSEISLTRPVTVSGELCRLIAASVVCPQFDR
jgi:hypothetical protein